MNDAVTLARMRQRLQLPVWAAALLLVMPAALAQTPASCPPVAQMLAPERIQAGMRDAVDHGFLWRISKGGRASYLFGTVHVATVDWMFPGPRVVQALRSADVVALELDMLDPDIQRRMAQGMATHPGTALPEPLAQRLQRQVQAACLPAEALAKLSPEMQVTTLTVLAARRDGLDPSYGIDMFLAGFARGAKKAVVSLETPEQQLQLLQMQNPVETIAFVEASLSDLETGRARQTLARITKVWADSNHAELARYGEWCECRETAADRDAMKRMLDDRNPALADRIAALHTGGKQVFAAVGSLHMIGPLGLPALMAQRGYHVEKLD